MPSWEDVVALAAHLPGVEEGTWYRTPALKVRGRSLCRMKEDGELLVLKVEDLGEKEALLQGRADVYTTTPHYDGYPAVLVRLAQADPAELRELLEDAWRREAPKRLVTAHDAGAAG